MRVRNCAGRPLVVEGRLIDPSAIGDVNSRHPEVAAHLDAGRLRRLPPDRPTKGQEDHDE